MRLDFIVPRFVRNLFKSWSVQSSIYLFIIIFLNVLSELQRMWETIHPDEDLFDNDVSG